MAEEDDQDTCVSEVLQSKAVGVIFKKLSGFSEYNVTVTSYLDHFNQSDSSFKLGRTRNFFLLYFKVCPLSPFFSQFRTKITTGR